MGASGDLDELRKTVPNLGNRKGSQECEIEESVNWCMVCAESIFVVAIIDSNFDRNGSVYETNHGSRNSYEVRVPFVGGTRKSGKSESRIWNC